jgi:uncharacterized phage protein (TIGR02220 family)/predicted phage replisome organizer
MPAIDWIKLKVDMFDDEKIRLIKSEEKNGDSVILFWIWLLSLGGKTNNQGLIYLDKGLPYSEKSLARLYDKTAAQIKNYLNILKKYKLIDIFENGNIAIVNWEKHQNVEGMDKVREKAKIRQQNRRKKLESQNKSVTGNGTNERDVTLQSRDGHAIESDTDTDTESDKEYKENMSDKSDAIPFSEIVGYLNEKTDSNYRATGKATQRLIKARWNESYRLEDFKKVIDHKTAEWTGTEWEKFLVPETLFGTKFEKYLNQKPTFKKSKKSLTDYDVGF